MRSFSNYELGIYESTNNDFKFRVRYILANNKIILNLFLFFPFLLPAQPGCPNIDAGADQTLNCSNPCVSLTATVLATGATTSYDVSSIPYNPPYAYNSGTPILVNEDDIWSDVINLPFSFCFFGTLYNQIVVGANGCITFDITNSKQYCAWADTIASCPDPNMITSLVRKSTGPYILGPYHDIDPRVGGQIYQAVLGVYPCRTFVLNYYRLPMFNTILKPGPNCNSLLATQQIVIYESTNVIEVYMKDKPVCTKWNRGNATIGIQNAAGDVGFSPPGRNTSQWTATNEAWRFTPNGTPNYSITWWQGTNPVDTNATITVCLSATTTYTAQVVYKRCDSTQITLTDSVTVTAEDMDIPDVQITSATDETCGFSNGSISATSSTTTCTQGLTYTWNSTPPQSLQTASNLPAGTYTVTVACAGCSSTATTTITNHAAPSVSTVSSDATCGSPVGAASATASGGTGNYTYLWNTNPQQTTDTVTGLAAGTYIVTVNDGNCTTTASAVVKNISEPTAGFSVNPSYIIMGIPASFADNSSGNIKNCQWNFGDGNTGTGLTTEHQYDITGDYTVTLIITDDNGCMDTTSRIIKVNDIFTFYIPDAFSPNGDGVNDLFTPQGMSVDPDDFEMDIFDRWGNLVFHTNKWDMINGEAWNGTKNNSGPANKIVAGVYIYHIKAKEIYGVKHEYFGRVTVIK